MISMIIYAFIVLGIVGLDQLTKYLTDGVRDVQIIKDILYISSTRNTGAAFSMLGDAPWAQTFFYILTVVAVTGATIYLVMNKRNSKWLNVTITILIAGALGNFIDRIALKYVRDFIYVTFFANFNVADIAITVGAIMLVVYVLFIDKEALFKFKKKEDPKTDENA